MAGSSDIFNSPTTIRDAYSTLISQLGIFMKEYDLPVLKLPLIRQARTPDGVKFNKDEKSKIISAKSTSELLCIVGDISCCDWLDTRLIETLAHRCGLLSVKLLDAYKHYVLAKKLNEALPSFPKQPHANEFVTEVCIKMELDQIKVTLGDVVNYKWAVESVILDFSRQTMNIANVNTECLEINCHIPIHCSFDAYKMALHNRHKFYTINLIHIKIGNHPLINDPGFCGFKKNPSKKTLRTQNEGMYK